MGALPGLAFRGGCRADEYLSGAYALVVIIDFADFTSPESLAEWLLGSDPPPPPFETCFLGVFS